MKPREKQSKGTVGRLLVYLGHPAHYHLFKECIDHYRERGEVKILIKKKDILEDLLQRAGLDYVNIYAKERGGSTLSTALAMLKKAAAIASEARRFKPDLMVGTAAEVAQIGRLLGIPSFIFEEDDVEIIPQMAMAGYRFAHHLVAPSCCSMGKWVGKTITYPSYHELAYLHPNHFRADAAEVARWIPMDRPFHILRFAKLGAFHDGGRRGLTKELAARAIARLEKRGRVFITSERELEPEFEPYRLAIDPLAMHHVLAFASLYLGDSQTMAAEAAVLGTPSIRFNDFVGQIGYLEELEHRYRLTFGIPTSEPERLLELVETLSAPGMKAEWAVRRERMLAEKIDYAAFMISLLTGYPESVRELKGDSRPELVAGRARYPSPAVNEDPI